jgi:hypothetical protein
MKKIFVYLLSVILIISLCAVFIPLFSNREGADGPGASITSVAPSGSTSYKYPSATGTSPSGEAIGTTSGGTMSSLDKFVNALTSAFSPPAAPPAKKIAVPEWTTYKAPLSPGESNVNQCSFPIQHAVETLPIDQQSKDIVDKHTANINSILDVYDNKLKAYEEMLNASEKILTLNKKIDVVSNLGIPTATVVYDNNANTVISLSVVKGSVGLIGGKGNKIDGQGALGQRGSVGVEGENPLPSKYEELPFWSK